MELSIVIPARNEQDRIQATLSRVARVTSRLRVRCEILLGDSASTDATVERALQLRMPGLRVVRLDKPGKGRVLTRALSQTRGRVVGFVDADLEIDPGYLKPLYAAICGGADAAIASKTLDPTLNEGRERHRRWLTGGYNGLVRALFRTGISDHQAGLKLFDGRLLRGVLPRIRSNEWLWDTEVLVALRQLRADVVEVPVALAPSGPSHVSLKSAWFGTARDLTSIYVRSRLGIASAEPAMEGPSYGLRG